MRTIDQLECEAVGRSGKTALRDAWKYSDHCWTALVNGRPEAMFGWRTESAIEGRVTPWFLGTDTVYRHGRALLAMGPYFVERLVDSSRFASNIVSADNLRAIRLLRCWGFTVDDEVTVLNGVPFHAFWIKR